MTIEHLGRPKQNATPTAGSLVFRVIIFAATGIALVVAGILRFRAAGDLTTVNGIFIAIGVLIVGFAAWALRQLPAARALDRDGVVVKGRVINKWTRLDQDNDRENYVAFEYGDGYSAKERVGARVYRSAQIGGEVYVRYLPADPSRCRIEK